MDIKAAFAKVFAENRDLKRQVADLHAEYASWRKSMEGASHSVWDEINALPGRRVYFNLVATLDFTISVDGQRGQAMNFSVSQDGPFIQTAYPIAMWKPSAPNNATNFGLWSPVYSWPLATQQNATGDRIDLSYEINSGGSQRMFQNLAAPPLLSRPDAVLPLPQPTIFQPNENIQFFPTFEKITFDGTVGVPTTGGTLVVLLPGFKCANQ